MTAIDRYLQESDPTEVLQLAQDLHEMQQTAGWKHLSHLLDVHRVWNMRQLTMPVGIKEDRSATHYASVAGIIRGIEHVEMTVQEVYKIAEKVREALAARNGDR